MEDSIAFVNGHIEPSQDFDWDIIEPDEKPSVEIEIRRRCAETLAKFVSQLLTVGGRNQKHFFLAANCLAFANHIHPGQSNSGEEIAKKIGMKKPAFFRRVNQWRDVLRLPHMAGAWSDKARKSIKTATTNSHAKRQKDGLKTRQIIDARFSRAHKAARM